MRLPGRTAHHGQARPVLPCRRPSPTATCTLAHCCNHGCQHRHSRINVTNAVQVVFEPATLPAVGTSGLAVAEWTGDLLVVAVNEDDLEVKGEPHVCDLRSDAVRGGAQSRRLKPTQQLASSGGWTLQPVWLAARC